MAKGVSEYHFCTVGENSTQIHRICGADQETERARNKEPGVGSLALHCRHGRVSVIGLPDTGVEEMVDRATKHDGFLRW